ncbi:MAG: MFS transporter [Acidimicrobiales bacterium]
MRGERRLAGAKPAASEPPSQVGLDQLAGVARANRRWLYAGRALRSGSTAFLTVVFPLYLAAEGYSSTRVGLVLTVGGFISAVVVLGVGLGGDRFGRRTMLIVVSALGVLGGVALVASTNLVVVMLANGLCGIGRGGGAGGGGAYGPLFPAEQPLLAASSDDRSRTAAFARLSFIGVAAGALGSMISWVPEVLHGAGWTWSAGYRAVFAIGAALSVLLVVVALPIREHRPHLAAKPDEAPQLAGSHQAGGGPKLSTRQLVGRLATVNTLNGFGYGFLGALLAYWFHVRYGVGPGAIGVLYTIVNLATMAPYLYSARLTRRLGSVRTVVSTRGIGLLFLLAMVWTPTFVLAGAAYAMRIVISSLGMPARQSYLMGVADERRRSSIAAVGSLPSQLSSSVSPIVGGALMESFVNVPILGAFVFMSANTVGYYLSFRHYRPPEERTGPLPTAEANALAGRFGARCQGSGGPTGRGWGAG